MLSARVWSRGTALAAVGILAAGGVVTAGPAGAATRYCQGKLVTIEATSSGTTVNGTEGPDVIDGVGRVRLTINGLGGDDVICTGPGHQVVVHGGDGNDSLQAEIGDGYGEPTTLYGEAGDDVLRIGPARAGELPSSGRMPVADGGEGDDEIAVDAVSADVLPGPGDDVVVGSNYYTTIRFGGTAGVRIDVPAGIADGEGHDTFSGIDSFIGTPGPDHFIGSDGDDLFGPSVDGVSSPDIAEGGGGNDSLRVARGSADGGAGDDYVYLDSGTLSGGDGDDHLFIGDSGTVSGGAGDDVLNVTRHKDRSQDVLRLRGDAGDDQIDLGYVGTGWGTACSRTAVCLTDVDGGTGRDRLSFRTRAGVSVDLRAGRASYASARSRVRAVEDVLGTKYADTLRGDARPNYLQGKGGNDVLSGRGGADRLIGGDGRDRADGGPGADRCQAEVRRSC